MQPRREPLATGNEALGGDGAGLTVFSSPRSRDQARCSGVIEKTRIDILLVLPSVPDVRDACIGRLRDLLEAKEGIDAAHVLEANAKQPDRICIHFNPNRMSLGQVRELARRAGAQLESRYGHIVRKSRPMHARLARSKSERLGQLDAVVEASVSPDGVVGTPPETLGLSV
jgi:Cd2+/Zn2+-exporting ATPase